MDELDTTLRDALGDLAGKVDDRVRSGEYASPDEVVRAGIEALEREEEAFVALLRVQEAMDDPRPWLSVEDMGSRMGACHREQMAKASETP